MKHYVSILLSILLLMFLLQSTAYSQTSQAPSHSAHAVSVIDVKSGRFLYEYNADQKLPIASLTKIMTAIVAIEEGNLEDKVKASKNAVGTEGSSIYLRLGEELTLEDMLYGLMLRSGNDAAVAIAEHIGGSVQGFAYLMNEKAKYIGLTSSNFVNPHGLDHPDHYSTARDLAILTAYALKNPTFQKIVATQVKTAPLEGYSWDRKWFNKNKMLRMYPGADGVKTGYTKIAKRTLVSSATRDGRQIVVVVLNDGNDWNDSARLLDYGFTQFHNVSVLEKTQTIDAIDPITKEQKQFLPLRDSIYPLMENEVSKITSKVVFTPVNRDPFTPVAYAEIYLGNELIDKVPLVEVEENKSKETSAQLTQNKNRYWSSWLLFWRYII